MRLIRRDRNRPFRIYISSQRRDIPEQERVSIYKDLPGFSHHHLALDTLGNIVNIGRMSKIAIFLFVALLVAVAVALPMTAPQFQGKHENRKILWKMKFRHFIGFILRL